MGKTLDQAKRDRAKAATEALKALTANRLADGIVVYMDGNGGWTDNLAEARLAENDEALEAMQDDADRAVANRIVVGVYPIVVAIENGIPVATSVRERIRAAHRTTLTKDWYDVPL